MVCACACTGRVPAVVVAFVLVAEVLAVEDGVCACGAGCDCDDENFELILLIHDVRREGLTLSLLPSLLLTRFSTFGRFDWGLTEACSLLGVVGRCEVDASLAGGIGKPVAEGF